MRRRDYHAEERWGSYQVVGFRHHGLDMSGAGFEIRLDRRLARACWNYETADDQVQRMTERLCDRVMYPAGQSVVKDCLPDSQLDGIGGFGARFEGLFLRNWSVPGNCACMGVDGMAIEDVVRVPNPADPRDKFEAWVTMIPHNVDRMWQAAALLAMFVAWHESVYTLLCPLYNEEGQ